MSGGVRVDKLVLRSFRGVVEGEVSLSGLTILVGPNNSGKTTVLEALLLLHGFRRVIGGLDTYDLLSRLHKTLGAGGLGHLVYGYGARVKRACVGYLVDGVLKAVVAHVGESDEIRFYFLDGVRGVDELLSASEVELAELLEKTGRMIGAAHRFRESHAAHTGKLLADVLPVRFDLLPRLEEYVLSRWVDVVESGIGAKVAEWVSKVADEDYVDILLEPFGDLSTHALYLCRSDRMRIRVGDVGDGVRTLVLARTAAELLDPDIILWDDVESHMNPRALQLLALWLADLVDQGKQVVVTTHSLEAATTIADVCGDAQIVRLSLRKGRLSAEHYGVEDVDRLKSLGVDVRA